MRERGETIYHFLFDCPQSTRERHLSNALCRNATSILYIITSNKATQSLMRCYNSTGRLKPAFGEITLD